MANLLENDKWLLEFLISRQPILQLYEKNLFVKKRKIFIKLFMIQNIASDMQLY